jgi:hypothetical protein
VVAWGSVRHRHFLGQHPPTTETDAPLKKRENCTAGLPSRTGSACVTVTTLRRRLDLAPQPENVDDGAAGRAAA